MRSTQGVLRNHFFKLVEVKQKKKEVPGGGFEPMTYRAKWCNASALDQSATGINYI